MTDPGRKARPKSAVVKALTVQQPWAWAIIHGGKSVENRTQAWSYRGPLAIHAGVRVSQRGLDSPLMRLPGTVELRSEVVDRELRMLWLVNDPDHALVLRKFGVRTPLGAIIGVVQLVDVHTAERGCCESPWAEAAYAEHSGRTRRDVVHLVLEHPRELAVPIPCRGALGLWTPPVDVVEQLGGAIAS